LPELIQRYGKLVKADFIILDAPCNSEALVHQLFFSVDYWIPVVHDHLFSRQALLTTCDRLLLPAKHTREKLTWVQESAVLKAMGQTTVFPDRRFTLAGVIVNCTEPEQKAVSVKMQTTLVTLQSTLIKCGFKTTEHLALIPRVADPNDTNSTWKTGLDSIVQFLKKEAFPSRKRKAVK